MFFELPMNSESVCYIEKDDAKQVLQDYITRNQEGIEDHIDQINLFLDCEL